jgi:hypothetical protein
MVPVLDQVLEWRTGEIRELLERNGLTLHTWEKARTDHVQIGATPPLMSSPVTASEARD